MSKFAASTAIQTVSDEQFDPVRDLLVAPYERPRHVLPVNMRVLSSYQRALLVIDGTVTSFIEAYTMEPLNIERIAQEIWILDEAHAQLDVEKGDEIAIRQVMIRGKYSRAVRVFATSLIAMSRVSTEIRRRLEIQGEGIGRILSDLRLETRREILWYGRERAIDQPEFIRKENIQEFLSRTYRIIYQQEPIALINEKFPADLEVLPAHH